MRPVRQGWVVLLFAGLLAWGPCCAQCFVPPPGCFPLPAPCGGAGCNLPCASAVTPPMGMNCPSLFFSGLMFVHFPDVVFPNQVVEVGLFLRLGNMTTLGAMQVRVPFDNSTAEFVSWSGHCCACSSSGSETSPGEVTIAQTWDPCNCEICGIECHYLGTLRLRVTGMTGELFDVFDGTVDIVADCMGAPLPAAGFIAGKCVFIRNRCGDCNLDGNVNVLDALTAAQTAVGIVTLPDPNFGLCNVDGVPGGTMVMGTTVDILDSLEIAQHAAGIPPQIHPSLGCIP